MPGQDKTGPSGQGPLTGRGLGYCGQGLARGRGIGRGLGRGFAWRAKTMQVDMPIQQIQPTVITEKQEKQFLEQELTALKEETKEIEAKLKELNKA